MESFTDLNQFIPQSRLNKIGEAFEINQVEINGSIRIDVNLFLKMINLDFFTEFTKSSKKESMSIAAEKYVSNLEISFKLF